MLGIPRRSGAEEPEQVHHLIEWVGYACIPLGKTKPQRTLAACRPLVDHRGSELLGEAAEETLAEHRAQVVRGFTARLSYKRLFPVAPMDPCRQGHPVAEFVGNDGIEASGNRVYRRITGERVFKQDRFSARPDIDAARPSEQPLADRSRGWRGRVVYRNRLEVGVECRRHRQQEPA